MHRGTYHSWAFNPPRVAPEACMQTEFTSINISPPDLNQLVGCQMFLFSKICVIFSLKYKLPVWSLWQTPNHKSISFDCFCIIYTVRVMCKRRLNASLRVLEGAVVASFRPSSGTKCAWVVPATWIIDSVITHILYISTEQTQTPITGLLQYSRHSVAVSALQAHCHAGGNWLYWETNYSWVGSGFSKLLCH